MTTTSVTTEDNLANQSINLLKYLFDQFGQEEFCVDDLPSFGKMCQYQIKHFKYLREVGHIVVGKPGVFTINEHSLAIISA